MKKAIVVAMVLCAMILIGRADSAFAADASGDQSAEVGKDLYLVFGYKAWPNRWHSSTTTYVPQGGANIQSFRSDLAIASIPSVSLKYKDFFISSGYMFSPTYTFPEYTDTINISGTPYTAKYKYTAKREEIDINAGYYVVSNMLGLTVGYKKVDQDYHLKSSGVGLVTTEEDSTTTISGLTLGIIGAAPIGSGFSLYGSGVAGFMKAKYSGNSNKDDAQYTASEFGMSYQARDWLSFSLGYKYQVIDTDVDTNNSNYAGQVAPDVTKGYVFGVNLIF